MSDTKYKPQESVADFRARITAIMRERETGKRYSVIGGPRANKCVVRRPSEFEVLRSDIENTSCGG